MAATGRFAAKLGEANQITFKSSSAKESLIWDWDPHTHHKKPDLRPLCYLDEPCCLKLRGVGGSDASPRHAS